MIGIKCSSLSFPLKTVKIGHKMHNLIALRENKKEKKRKKA